MECTTPTKCLSFSSILLKNPDENVGRWSHEEHKRFLDGWNKHGRHWHLIQKLVQTRSPTQVRSHAQKHFKRDPESKNHVALVQHFKFKSPKAQKSKPDDSFSPNSRRLKRGRYKSKKTTKFSPPVEKTESTTSETQSEGNMELLLKAIGKEASHHVPWCGEPSALDYLKKASVYPIFVQRLSDLHDEIHKVQVGKTPLSWTSYGTMGEAIEFILSCIANVDGEALRDRCQAWFTEKVSVLAEYYMETPLKTLLVQDL